MYKKLILARILLFVNEIYRTTVKKYFSKNESEWKGDHLIDRTHVPGVLFTNFKIKTETPNIMDIAPTILKLFGLCVPPHIDGVSLI